MPKCGQQALVFCGVGDLFILHPKVWLTKPGVYGVGDLHSLQTVALYSQNAHALFSPRTQGKALHSPQKQALYFPQAQALYSSQTQGNFFKQL